MKKIFVLFLFIFLAACGENGENKENPKEEIQEIKTEKNQVYYVLDGQILKDSFSNSATYTSLNFYDNGEFDGDFLSDSDVDGRDFGLKEESEKNYNRSEIHKSVFSGKFTLGKPLEKGVYKFKLDDFTINNETGPDTEIKYLSWVDFAKGLNKDDEYMLYLKGAVLDDYLLENNQYSEEEIENHNHEEDDDHNHEAHNYKENHVDHGDESQDEKYRVYSIIIYNKSQKLIFSSYDKWACTDHHH